MSPALQGAMDAVASTPLWKGLAGALERHQQGSGRRQVMRQRCAPTLVVPPRCGSAFDAQAPFAALIPGDSVGEAVITTGLLNFLNLYNSALIVRLVLTWFPNPPEFIQQPLATVTDPYLNLFRGIIPPLGGTLDLSPILAFVTLNFFTSTAAALPCELGPEAPSKAGQQQQQRQPLARASNPFQFMQPTRLQTAWQQRMGAQRAAKEGSQGPVV